ncbi:hypothetical protein GGU10DRAFT_311458 [Lentinula aff. detonsa]|uniref:GmrSD restriction endonucleases N-terminal domain-containing protein n=1 Tax=Lentinula aff. detonsa TaxID=2804958 RepID=A0AA38NM84_9AGAR|nr:hypothetical protein GGU10DRAFT_311458 [Lentinula aff. detonsa]
MSSSESELTDLIYDEIEDEGSEYENEKTARTSSKSQRKQSGVPAPEYKLQKTLKPPRATTYAARALYEQIYNSDIDLSPEYQRDVVWTKEKQTNLIDSIYRNYYIPPIIFAVSIDDDGAEHRTCIDGKQRLTSIQLFMDGLVSFYSPGSIITGHKYWYRIAETGEKKTKALLPERLRAMFANKQIVCVEYAELTDAEERDIFKRVQQGIALKPSEKLGAISTPRSAFIRRLLVQYVTEDTLGNIPWATSRGGDFRCFSHAVFCMEKWSSDPDEVKDHGALSHMEKWLAGPNNIAKGMEKQIREVYDIFVKLATTAKYSAPFKMEYKKVSPAEMVFIPLLIFVHAVLPPEELRYSRRELSTAITNMRRTVRQYYHDVRMNTRVGKFLVEFIKKMETKEFERDPEPVKPAKIKRKRNYKTEEDERPLSTGPSHRTLMTPVTPTTSFTELNIANPDPLSTASAPKKRKQTSSTTTGFNASPPAQRPLPSTQMATFQTHIPLSPTSSGSHTADHDMGRGPLNGKVTLNDVRIR